MSSVQSGEKEKTTPIDFDGIRVLNVFTDPRLGGPGNRALSIAKKISLRGVEPAFLIPHGEGDLASAARGAGHVTYREQVPRVRSPRLLRENVEFLTTFPQTVRRLQKRIEKDGADIVHVNTPYNFQPALAASQSDASLVWHFNDTHTPPPIRQISAYAARKYADEIVVAADAVCDYYFNSKPDSQTIYAPVDINQFNPEHVNHDETSLRSELGLTSSIPVIGTIGNINPIKGHKYLLQAIAELVSDDREVVVPVVGAQLDSRKQYFGELRDLRAELNLESTVEFVGFRSDVPELLSLFDVFVLPSIAEACPIVVLEAMAMKCPVVATDVGGVSEEIPDSNHGWVVPPKDSDALAQAITAALNNPKESQRRAANARERVESMFSLEACVDRHEELYRSLVEET